MKILSIVNQKGGVGKTTTTINLSACLSKMKRRVLLIDLDPQSNATRGSGIDATSLEHSINDVLLDRVPIEDAIVNSQHDGYDILPSTPEPTESEVSLVAREEREYILRNKLIPVSNNYDYILTARHLLTYSLLIHWCLRPVFLFLFNASFTHCKDLVNLLILLRKFKIHVTNY